MCWRRVHLIYCICTKFNYLLFIPPPPPPNTPIFSHFNLGDTWTRHDYQNVWLADLHMCSWLVFNPSPYHWLKGMRQVDFYGLSRWSVNINILQCSAILRKGAREGVEKRKEKRNKEKERGRRGTLSFYSLYINRNDCKWMLWPLVSLSWP